MAAKLCNVCGKRRIGTGGGDESVEGLCNPCATESGWENTHGDHDHDGIAAGEVVYGLTTHKTEADFQAWLEVEKSYMEHCWICHPELNLAQKPVKASTGARKQGFRRPQLNHKGHSHPQTPAARRACKAAFWAAMGGTANVASNGQLGKAMAEWNHTCDSHGKVVE